MDTRQLKTYLFPLIKKWWCSLLLLPFIIYSLHQAYWTLRFNIFFSVTYETPFPINFIHFMLDNFLLIVHEAGHTFFSVFGVRTITILGGSLFEVLLPVIILSFFWINKKKVAIQLSLYMVGFAFLQVAFYAADGGARQLPLIGGLSKESHDWYNLLAGWGMLDSDITVGVFLVITGALCYLAALLVPLYFKKYESVRLDLEV